MENENLNPPEINCERDFQLEEKYCRNWLEGKRVYDLKSLFENYGGKFFALGQEGVVAKSNIDDHPVAIKVYSTAATLDFIKHDMGYPENFSPRRPKYREDAEIDVILSAIGFELGHKLKPQYIDPILGLIAINNQIVGYIVDYYEGEKQSVNDIRDSDFLAAVDELNQNGIKVDTFFEAENAIVSRDGGEIHLIDLYSLPSDDIDPTFGTDTLKFPNHTN